jgi:DNA polymerase-3 subunit delta
MFGDRRLLWIEPAGEDILPALEALLAAPQVESPAVAIAGVLKKGSALAKLADSHPAVLSHVSYVPEGRDAVRVIVESGREMGLRVSTPIAERIAAAAAGDQQIARQELAKYALFLDASADLLRDLDEEVLDLLGADASEADHGRAGDLALMGEVGQLADELQRRSGASEAIPVLRALQRRLVALASLRARVESGQAVEAVMTSVWRRDQPAVRRMLPQWTAGRIADVFQRVQELERQLLLSPVGEREALGEALLQIARVARR